MSDEKVVDLSERRALRASSKAALASKPTLEEMAADDERIARLLRARHMLFALVRAQGRVRITAAELEGIAVSSALDIKVQKNGDLVVSLVER